MKIGKIGLGQKSFFYIISIGLAALPLLSRVALASSSGDDERRKVSVSGVCHRQVTPDRGAIVLTSEFRDKDLKVAASKATEAYERVRDAIKRLNLEDLDVRTVEYSLGLVREWEKNKTVDKGYRARMGLRVATSSIQRLGEVIALAAREGLQDVGQLTTFLSDEKSLKEHTGCLQEAAENAKVKADRLAGALGAKVGQVLLVTEEAPSGGLQPRMAVQDFAMSGRANVSAPSIEAGQQTLDVGVQAVFLLH